MQTISSERLILRPFTERDVNDLYRYAADPNVGPHAGWKPHESREESLEIIQMFLRDGNVWAIEQKNDHRVIGSLGLHDDKWRNYPDARMFGYVLASDCWGRGYMSEAVLRAMEHGFLDLSLRLLSVSHYTFNDRSRRVIEKCGFVYEGTLRQTFQRYDGEVFDEAIYSITKDEWLARRKNG